MPTNQGDRQAFFRAISGTTTEYNGDFLAAAAVDGFTGEFNGVFIEWLQDRTGSSATNLDGLKQEFAVLAGAHNWESVGGVPIILSGLQLWLDANASSTITESSGKVSQWGDKSGKGNNALQGTGADQPTFTTNHINGKSVLTFNGIVEEMDLTSDLALTGEFTIFLVANNEDTASTRVIFGHDTDNNKIATLNPTKAFVRIMAATAGDSSQDYLAENATGIQIIQRNSSDKIDMAFNGAAFTRLFSDVAQSGTSSWNRIGVGEGTSSWKGDIAEIIIYNRALAASEITVVNRYLAPKWGITLA